MTKTRKSGINGKRTRISNDKSRIESLSIGLATQMVKNPKIRMERVIISR